MTCLLIIQISLIPKTICKNPVPVDLIVTIYNKVNNFKAIFLKDPSSGKNSGRLTAGKICGYNSVSL